MIRVETDPQRGEITLHVDDDGARTIAEMAEEVRRVTGKGFLGDAGAMLIIRHERFGGSEDPDDVPGDEPGEA